MSRAQRRLFLACDVARVVLVDIELAVQPERIGVGPQEPLDVRVAGQDVELIVFEGPQILGADFRARLELGDLEPLTRSSLPEAGANLEHEADSVETPANP